MDYTLALDTSQRYLAVGIARNQEILAAIQYPAWQQQSELTTQELAKAFDIAKISPNQLTRIIVTIGPGSYTGIRIALTIAKVMAYSLKIPLYTVSSLQALAGLKEHQAVLLDARGSRAYFGLYHQGIALQKDQVLPLDQVTQFLNMHPEFSWVGDTTLIHQKEVAPNLIENLVQLAQLVSPVEDVHTVVPTYLKD